MLSLGEKRVLNFILPASLFISVESLFCVFGIVSRPQAKFSISSINFPAVHKLINVSPGLNYLTPLLFCTNQRLKPFEKQGHVSTRCTTWSSSTGSYCLRNCLRTSQGRICMEDSPVRVSARPTESVGIGYILRH